MEFRETFATYLVRSSGTILPGCIHDVTSRHYSSYKDSGENLAYRPVFLALKCEPDRLVW